MSDDEGNNAEAQAQRKAQEAKGKAKKGKKKGLGGLSREKRKLLKELIMQKAADEMKEQMAKKKQEKDSHIKSVMGTLNLDGLSDDQLVTKVKELYKRYSELEEAKYDIELKIRKQEFEINELTLKVNDVKGKFVKPVLKKVSKTETKMSKFMKSKSDNVSFRDKLKSTGQNKFALDEKDEQKKSDAPEESEENNAATDNPGQEEAGTEQAEAPPEAEPVEEDS